MKIPKILLIDNSRFFLEINKLLLEDSHFQTLIATDRKQALQIIRTEHPDLIIMDIVMPRLDGGKICAELNMDVNIRSIPLIMIVDDDTEDIKYALAVGCRDYITKPLDNNSIIEIIHKNLPIIDRRDPRVNCNMPVVLQIDDNLIMVPCDNISISGMFVKGNLKIKEGIEVTISFRLPGEVRDKAKIKAKGHVVWINNKMSLQSKVPIGFGIQLDEIIGERINKQHKKELKAFIEANKE